MQTTQDFTGLGMPVFTAFGWAGEETAIQYALSQLEEFAVRLSANMPVAMRNELPHFGLSKESNSAYLSADLKADDDLYVAFNARPTSLEIQLGLTNKSVLSKGYKLISANAAAFSQVFLEMGAGWELRLQQVLINEDTGDSGHYQDLYKDQVSNLDPATAQELFERAAFLNSEDKWIVPLFLSQRLPAEQVSAMGLTIIDIVIEKLKPLAPMMPVIRGQKPKKARAAKAPKKAKKTTKTAKSEKKKRAAVSLKANAVEFEFTTELKPLHLRRGFINLTPQHWPFFALNARTETRSVVVATDAGKHEDCAVWRLQPRNMARLVLGPAAHAWLEEHFVAGDLIQLDAAKDKEANKIEIKLLAPE